MGITNCWNCNGTGWVLDMPCNQLGCNAPKGVRAPVSTIDYNAIVGQILKEGRGATRSAVDVRQQL